MCTIITRSAIIHWGGTPAPNLHSIVEDWNGRREVTWDDVMAERRKRQAEILRSKLMHRPWRAYRLSVGYFGSGLLGGWHAWLQNLHEETWVFRCRWLVPDLMRLFPLVLPIGDESHQWRRLMLEFAKRYKRGRQLGQPRGATVVRWNGHDAPKLWK